MAKMILTDKDCSLFYEDDGVLTSKKENAKVFTSLDEVEKISIRHQLNDNPIHWINNL